MLDQFLNHYEQNFLARNDYYDYQLDDPFNSAKVTKYDFSTLRFAFTNLVYTRNVLI